MPDSTPLGRARSSMAAEKRLANDVSQEALCRMEIDELFQHSLLAVGKVEALKKRVKRYYAVYAMEHAYDASAMDADGDGKLDEHSWEQIREEARSEPSLDALVREMDNAQMEVDAFKDAIAETKQELAEACEDRTKAAAAFRAAERAAEGNAAVAAAQAGILQEKEEKKKAEWEAGHHDRLVKNKARHGYAPPDSGLVTCASFFGNGGIFPTKVPMEMHDMRMHRPLGYRYHIRAQIEAPLEIQSDNKSVFINPTHMPQAHAFALDRRGAARPGYPYLRSYEWPTE